MMGIFDNDPFEESPFSGLFQQGFPRPPDSLPLGILHLSSIPMTQEALTAAFRNRVLQTHPDVTERVFDPLTVENAEERGRLVGSTEFQEVVWARKVLKRRIPVPPGGGGPGFSLNPKHCDICNRIMEHNEEHPHPDENCNECHGRRKTPPKAWRWNQRVERGRWEGYCRWCAEDLRKEADRERRRQARADRECPVCGAVFTPARSDGRYCSAACRQKSYRSRRSAVAADQAHEVAL